MKYTIDQTPSKNYNSLVSNRNGLFCTKEWSSIIESSFNVQTYYITIDDLIAFPIQIFKKGIWNIHYGPLPEIRGRHPISWGFIENMEFGVSIHQINEEIDKGILIAKAYVERDIKDTQIEIENKIEDTLCNGLLYQAIINWNERDTHILDDGKYFQSLANKFNSIDPVNYSSKFIFNLFKSQYKFGGVVINDQNFTQCSFYNEEFPDLYEECVKFTCQDGVLIALN